jgi:nucleotide-binding universal stress UspA family protein
MYRTILVPLDGSPLAECAVPYAETVARASGAQIVLLRATVAHTLLGTGPGDEVAAEQEAEEYLAGVATRLSDRSGVVTATFYGAPAEAIIEEIRLREADLVVMATHGRAGLGRLVFGSVAEAVLDRSPVPVLLVRVVQEELPVALVAECPRLLVPLDGSAVAEEALPVAQELAKAIGGELLLLHAVVPPEQARTTAQGSVVAYLDQELAALEAEARGYLRQVSDRLATGQEPSPPQIDARVGRPADVIAEASREHEVALVVMTTPGRTGLARVLSGSVADEVLRHGSVPLLLVGPAAVHQAA